MLWYIFWMMILMKKIVFLAGISLAVSACTSAPSQNSTMSPSTPSTTTLCIADQATLLIGQNDLSEAKIKSLTKASHVRKVGPNQPVTMDYREDRVTVVVDPTTKKIIQASCG